MLAKTNVLCLTIAMATVLACLSQNCWAQGPNKKALRREQALQGTGVVDGAIWRFGLRPQKGSGPQAKPPLKGTFRMSNFEIFQGETPDGEFTKKIGTSKFIDNKEASAEFEKLAGYTDDKKRIEMKGKAVMKLNKDGDWEGDFVDSSGFKWDFKIHRTQE